MAAAATSTAMEHRCMLCNKAFKTDTALKQHTENSPKHISGRSAAKPPATAPASVPVEVPVGNGTTAVIIYECPLCLMLFNDPPSIADHILRSKDHLSRGSSLPPLAVDDPTTPVTVLVIERIAATYKCPLCSLLFLSPLDVARHLRRPSAHAAPMLPSDVNSGNAFGVNGESTTDGQSSTVSSHKAKPRNNLKERKGGSKRKEENRETEASPAPLDRFFSSFAPFPYNPRLSPDKSFRALSKYFGWDRRSRDGSKAWEDYSRAMYEEIRMWFGSEKDIHAWHHLCRAIGEENPPDTPEECKKILRSKHVNIVDLLNWGRSEQVDSHIKVYKTEKELVDYTRETRKYFPQIEMQNSAGEENIVLRHLLRKMGPRYAGLGLKYGH